jgi:hypothetical protein
VSRRAQWLVCLAAGIAILVATDFMSAAALVSMDGRWDSLLVHGYGAYQAQRLVPEDPSGFRVGDSDSVVILPGFGARAPVRVRVVLASAVRSGLAVTLSANDAVVARTQVGGRPRALVGRALADSEGRLRLQVTARALRHEPGHYRLFSVAGRGARRRPPAARTFEYGLVVAGMLLALGVSRRTVVPHPADPANVAGRGTLRETGGPHFRRCVDFGSTTVAVIAAVVALLGFALLASKPLLVACLPALAVAALAFAALVGLLRKVPAIQAPEAAACALALVVRILFVLHPAFPSIDAVLHSHRLDTFKRGELVLNVASISDAAPTPVWLPYPPMPYAVLSFFSHQQEDVDLVRLATALVEVLVPFLLFAIARASGATPRAAALTLAAAAVMPEGLLVVAKGIAANAIGMLAVLGAMYVTVRRLNIAVVIGMWTLAFLGHLGPAVGIGLMGVCWYLIQWRHGKDSTPRASTLLLAVSSAMVLAFVLYYRESWAAGIRGLAMVEHGLGSGGHALEVDWVGIGKLVQNLVVKFGLLVPAAAVVAFRRELLGATLRHLLTAWLTAGAILMAVGLTTPCSFRFEYFLVGAVTLAAAHGLAHWEASGHPHWSRWALFGSLAIQVVLGVVLLQGWWDPINFIIPSPRWWLTS